MKQTAIAALSLILLLGAAPKEPVTTAELSDPAGDVQPGSTSDGERPPYDVIHLTLTSDGKNVIVAATLKDQPGTFATNVVSVYIDTDNNKSTGVETFWGKKPGFEYVADVDACINYADGAMACVGGMSANARIKSRFAVADVSKYGTDSMQTTSVRSVFKATQTPIEGKVVKAVIPYEDLGLKSGKVVRIVARESDGPYDATADFPEVLLKVK